MGRGMVLTVCSSWLTWHCCNPSYGRHLNHKVILRFEIMSQYAILVLFKKCCVDLRHHHGTSTRLFPQPNKALSSEHERGSIEGGGRWVLLPSLHWELIPVILRRKLPHLFTFYQSKTDPLWPMAVHSTAAPKTQDLMHFSFTSTCEGVWRRQFAHGWTCDLECEVWVRKLHLLVFSNLWHQSCGELSSWKIPCTQPYEHFLFRQSQPYHQVQF